jgi:hypothetical protein
MEPNGSKITVPILRLSTEAFYARRKESNIFKILKKRICKPRILSPAKSIINYQEAPGNIILCAKASNDNSSF